MNPFIIHCTCKNIISDSFYVISLEEKIICSTVVNTIKKFKKVLCQDCKKEIGVFENDLYFFNKKKIIIYNLGQKKNGFMSYNEIVEEIGKLKKFCVFLNNKITKKE